MRFAVPITTNGLKPGFVPYINKPHELSRWIHTGNAMIGLAETEKRSLTPPHDSRIFAVAIR
jgi:hypothetical protein